MPEYIYQVKDLGKKHGDKVVLKDVNLSFMPGAKIGVLGKNGTGKSSLLKIMAGWDKEFEGEAKLAPGFSIGFVPQEPRLNTGKDVTGNVLEAVEPIQKVLDRYNEINAAFAEPMTDEQMNDLLAEQQKVSDEIERLDAWNLERRIEVAMDAMRLPPGDADVSKLSGGERRRVALCRTLLEAPDMLLLDEPTNHLDAESVGWLEQHLAQYKGTVVAVTHDRYFLDNVAEWILELDRGKGIPYKGNYGAWLEQKHERLRVEDKREANLRKTLERELEWVRATPKARNTKSKARLARFEDMQGELNNDQLEALEMQIPPGPPLGQQVIEATGLTKSFGDKLLFENLSFRIPPGAIVGIIGPNGAGKTTLFRMLAGEMKPDSGSIKLGESVKLGYVDQNREDLDDMKNVWEEVSQGAEFFEFPGRRMNTRGYVSQFGFKGPDQQKLMKNLSGGERNRVHLAKLLSRGLNVIMFDEPTNDLDVDTLRALEEAVMAFKGCAIVTSHDRWFLDRIATHILAFEGNSQVYWCEGNFQIYEAGKKERLGLDADQPHRIKYRKLTG